MLWTKEIPARKTMLNLATAMLSLSLLSTPLIPREELFRPTPCLSFKISPDSKRLAFVGANAEGTMNLYLTSGLSQDPSTQVTHFEDPEIRFFFWAPDGNTIFLLKDTGGTKQYHLYALDVRTQNLENLTATYSGISSKIFHVSYAANQAVIGINQRNPKFHDLYVLDLTTKKLSLIQENNDFIHFIFDDQLHPVAKIRMNADSSITILGQKDNILIQATAEDAFHTECLRYNEQDTALYLIDNRDCDTSILKKIDLNGLQPDLVLGHDKRSDINDVIFQGNTPIAYATYYTQKEWHPLQTEATADLDAIIDAIGPNFDVTDQTREENYWILRTNLPDEGLKFWLFNQLSHTLRELYSAPQCSTLAKMYPLVIRSQDGLDLVSYLSLPPDQDLNGRPPKPLPLVVIPHGGPFKVRDTYAYSPLHQWLANRGYAVLSVNFRLSSGFGKDFVNAGNKNWGKDAHRDILDAVAWCVNEKIAEKGKIGIYGNSYGGFEALAGLTFTPEAFACSVAICAPSNLKHVLDHVPFFWELPVYPLSQKTYFFTKNAFITSMGGNPDIPNEIPYLDSCSPLYYADKIQRPLLLVHGMNDPIVTSSASDQIFEKMQQKGLPVLYLSFPDEGHGMTKFTNLICCQAYSEWLLSQFLGGRFEPFSTTERQRSSARIQTSQLSAETLFK